MLVKNETDNDLSQIQTFVKKHSKTNILVLELPDRYDLNTHSSVNRDRKIYSKLSKYMKAFEYALAVEVNNSRNHYTRHEFHLNNRGKEVG
jgi:stress-induced morphogen